MRLLILTQKVDIEDDVLGFFHRWIEEFSKNMENLTVVCLEEGKHRLPENVKVLSLGKEKGVSKFKYVLNFYKYIWQQRFDYNQVFVHMNQEYILLGGIIWKILGKKIYMWRNHFSGSVFTGLTVFFCRKIFCTSKFSYTAKYKKNIIMPVGIDTDIFKKIPNIKSNPRSILSLGRIASSKNLDFLIKGLETLSKREVDFHLSVYGNALQKDEDYEKALKDYVNEKKLSDKISFHRGVPNNQTPEIYNGHEVFVNLSPDGMYDKTILEAMACEKLVLVSNRNLIGEIKDNFLFEKGNLEDFALKLELLLATDSQKSKLGRELREYVISNHSLKNLSNRLFRLLKKFDE